MDVWRRWDAGGYEAGVGAGGAGGCGEHECGGVEVFGGSGVSWQVDGGVMDEDGAVGGAGGS